MKPTRIVFVFVAALLAVPCAADQTAGGAQTPCGELRIRGVDDGPRACPLKRTEVHAEITGFVGRTTLWQTFENPLDEKIEAVYVFPLPSDAAVDDMTMYVGDRRIVGRIMTRPKARATYEAAKRAGHVASLLDQERPNIFTQSVANIEPGAQVIIQISYLETLKYEEGWYEYVFPMTVGERYIPGGAGDGASPATAVPDAAKLAPARTPPDARPGHDISVTVHVDAGMPLQEVIGIQHEVDVDWGADRSSTVTLKQQDEIPNRDFIMRYRTATDKIEDALLLYADKRGAFFTLILQPPRKVAPEQAAPKEMIFVIDRSGSMSGRPIEKAKETMALCIERMNPNDTFNLLSFSGGTGRCFEKPVLNTDENRATALKYLKDLHGSGGTEMMAAVKAALEGNPDPERLRIVCFMTDGYIGNDFALIDAVKRNAGAARVFSFGIGSSVNRFLLDGMAREGRGAVEYVTLREEGKGAAERFQKRIDAPVMTDVEIDWGSLAAVDVYPKRIPDLFSEQPIMVHGRLPDFVDGTIVLKGRTVDGPFAQELEIKTTKAAPTRECLASLWARAKVWHLMHQDLAAVQNNSFPKELKDQVVELALAYRLMTQFTSFVAVEVERVTLPGPNKRTAVPAASPEGVEVEVVEFTAGATHDPLLLGGGLALLLIGVFCVWRERRGRCRV